MDLLCKALHNWRKPNRERHRGQEAACKCDCPNLRSCNDMRIAITCPRLPKPPVVDGPKRKPIVGVDYDRQECITRTCETCKDGKLLKMCESELSVERPITFMLETPVEYETNKRGADGKSIKKSKNEFKDKTSPIGEFMGLFNGKSDAFFFETPLHDEMAARRLGVIEKRLPSRHVVLCPRSL